MASLLALLPAGGHDQLWFLLMARRWIAGATLYGPQAFDANPPAIVWLSAMPVWLATTFHLPATFFAKLLVVLLGSACSLLSFRLLPLAWRPVRRFEAVALLFSAIVLFFVVPARDFGQRDHLASFLLLPYTLAAAIDRRRFSLWELRVASGILAAVAVCLKPHYALVPLVLESALLFFPKLLLSPSGSSFLSSSWSPSAPVAKRSASAPADVVSTGQAPGSGGFHLLRPEPVLIILLGAMYVIAIHRWAPLYFTSALPVSRNVYWAIGHLSPGQLLWEAIELCILATVTVWLFSRRPVASPAVRFLLLAGAAGFAAYLIQGTGWYYQQLPAISFFGAALALELLDDAGDALLRLPSWLPQASAALVLLAVALTTHFTGYPFTHDRAFAIDSPEPAFFQSLSPGTPVAILSTSVDETMMPVERYHLTWAQRTNNLWLLPAILRSERPEGQLARHVLPSQQVDALDMLQHRWMIEDLIRWHPELILIERCQDETVRCQVLEDRHDNLLAWFERDPAFATLWQQHYTLTATRDRFDAYQRTR